MIDDAIGDNARMTIRELSPREALQRQQAGTPTFRCYSRALHRNDLEPEVTGKARIGDIRHCFCDGSKAADKLGFRAEKDFDEGLAELAEWVAEQEAHDRVDEARAELEAKGLVA